MKKFTLLAAICCFGFVFQAKAQSSDCEKDTTITASIFGGESYDFNGQILTEAGMYIDTLQSVLGCDSIVTLILNKYEYDINVPYINLGGTVVSEGAIKEINLSCVDNFQLEANILATGGTIYGYNVAQIPYNPPFPFVIPEPFAHSINLTHDDAFAEVAELPFPFCFYQNTYSQVLMGPNGNLSFNTSLTGQICAWQIPNTNFETDGMSVSSNYFNSIFGVMEDVDPSRVIQQGSGTFQWGILGQPGARAFVMSYNEVPLFQCNDIHNSYQTIMYEGTNIIEVYVKRRGQCGWNGGRGIIGVMNSNGTNATIAPGRNATDSWTTVNNGVNTSEAWRFTPVVSSEPNYTLTWNTGNNAPNSNVLELDRSDGDLTVVATLNVASCNGNNYTYQDSVKIIWTDYILVDSVLNIYDNQFPYVYGDTIFQVGTTSGQYTVYRQSVTGCDSLININLTVTPSQLEVETDDESSTITLGLEIPTDEPIVRGEFTVYLPAGISIDIENCEISETLAGFYTLTIINNGDGSWTFIITPAPAYSSLLRNIMLTANYQDIVHIAYNVPEGLEGNYTVIISDIHFIFEDETEINQDEIPVIINVGEQEMGVETLQATSLQIYPNPATDIVTIDGIQAGETVTITDLQGRIVGALRATPLHNGGQTINVSGLPSGVYLVRVGNNVGKLVKE